MARIKSQLTTKQVFWVCLAVLVAVIPQLYRLPLWFAPMLTAVIAYRFYVQIKHIKKAYNIILMMVAIAALLLIVYSQGFGLSREISVTILITMTVLKLLETYRQRDALLVVMLCYFVAMTRFLYSQDLVLVLYLLLSAWVTTHALAVVNYPHGKAWFEKQHIKASVGWLALALPFAVLFFLAFPRLGSPIWGSPDIFGEGKTGISGEMSPGSIIELFMDDSPAFRVTFEAGEKPDNNQLYWRGPVLSEFDGRTWTRHEFRQIRGTVAFDRQASVIDYAIEMEPNGRHFMFGLDTILRAPPGAMLSPASSLHSMTAVNQLKHYRLSSVVSDRLYQRLPDYQQKRLLDYPDDLNMQTQIMIQQWLAADDSAYGLINKSLNWFQSEGFLYSYSPPALDSKDVIDEFIYQSKRGFCEHFASTFVVMMRMAGLPARVVTGYQGGVDNGDYLLVKQSDAHAWAEVYIDQANHELGGYWQRVDPTSVVSPERLFRGSGNIIEQRRTFMDFAWLRQARENMDKYRFRWNKWVRDFNVSKQQALFDAIGIKHREGKNLAIMLLAILGLTGATIFAWMWWRQRPQYTDLQQWYLRLMLLFKKEPDIYASKEAGLEAVLPQIINKYPPLKSSLQEFQQCYLRIRYRNEQLTAADQRRLQHFFQRLKKDFIELKATDIK
ncbi:MAG: DUF3488 domain-containing protein [Proteobacteria bacterium]|nr:MAG: DUF3488 domain-containing protein [Pseudomonadota bacterium]